jgi:peptide/nickel transport system ATP-binding protein
MVLLRVEKLRTCYFTPNGSVMAVDGVSFELKEGETLGLVGESGCGKTTAALSIIRLLPSYARILEGRIIFNGIELTALDNEGMRRIRGKEMSMVFQGSMQALNPLMKIGDQIAESVIQHEHCTKRRALRRAKELLKLVGMDTSRISSYQHELSGGMRQRAMIAVALACQPKLLIADEPATALDVIVQARVLNLMRELKKNHDLSVIMITHDLSVVAEMCDRVAVMYAGKLVECGDIFSLHSNPLHPYTQGLLSAFPNIRGPRKTLAFIPGMPPNLLQPPTGCRFHPRCPYAMKVCSAEEPKLIEVAGARSVACHLVK